jgi:hypothetical protein
MQLKLSVYWTWGRPAVMLQEDTSKAKLTMEEIWIVFYPSPTKSSPQYTYKP